MPVWVSIATCNFSAYRQGTKTESDNTAGHPFSESGATYENYLIILLLCNPRNFLKVLCADDEYFSNVHVIIYK